MNILSASTILCISTFFLEFVLLSSKMRHDHAVVKYYDPQYTKDPRTFTFRAKRGEPYKTNITLTILHAWGRNVTVLFYYKKPRSLVEHEVFKQNVCDVANFSWFIAIMKKFTDIHHSCPILPATYHVKNWVLSPKTFPIILPEGDNLLGLKFVLTASKKLLFDVQSNLHVDK